MQLCLFPEQDPKQVERFELAGMWTRLTRRAGQEAVHQLQIAGRIAGGARATVSREYAWLEETGDAELGVLQSLVVRVLDESGACVGRERITATDLVEDAANGCIQQMVQDEKVQPKDKVLYFVAGAPEAEQGTEDTYRTPPAVDAASDAELRGLLEEAQAAQRCAGCEKSVCFNRSVVFTEPVREAMGSWLAGQSTDGSEVGGVLLGYVLQNAPGGAEILVTGQIPVPDPGATLLSWEISASAWTEILGEVAQLQSEDPALALLGSWHSHDLKAIREALGEPAQDECGEGTVLLPSANDKMLWDVSFGYPQMANAIYCAATHHLTVYRWRRGQPRYVPHLWVPECAASLGAPTKEAVS